MEHSESKSSTERFETAKVAGIGAIHFVHDIYTALLSPILPVLIEKLSLSLAQAGSLTVFMQFPSLFNPFLGTLADRYRLNRLFLILSPSLTAVCMCLLGITGHFAILAVILLVAGISVATLHVSAPVMVARLSGNQVGRGMGFFMLGGELARTMGPLVAVWSVSTLGLDGLWPLASVGLTSSVILYWKLNPNFQTQNKRDVSLKAMVRTMKPIITGVSGILIARAFLAAATTTFLPTYLYQNGHSLWIAGAALSMVELAGAAGVFLSGTLSDRFGRRRVLFAVILTAPLMLLWVQFSSGVLLIIALLLLGFTTISSGPVLMAVMLENAGDNQAAANGMYMAISFAFRSFVVVMVGLMSDAWGMHTAFLVCAFMAFGGLPFILMLPSKSKKNV